MSNSLLVKVVLGNTSLSLGLSSSGILVFRGATLFSIQVLGKLV